jgi:transcriptional regulator with XRE-family HTH domain
MATEVDERLAATLRAAREEHGWSIAALAERSGVSRAMISKVERGEASPTAALLGRLSGALGRTMSELLAAAEGEGAGAASSDGAVVARRADQPEWQDPESRYRRRAVSPPGSDVQLVEAELPRGASVAYPADAYAFVQQWIWVLEGTLTFVAGEVEHVLRAGDCLRLGAPAPCTFANRSRSACRYAVVVARRP